LEVLRGLALTTAVAVGSACAADPAGSGFMGGQSGQSGIEDGNDEDPSADGRTSGVDTAGTGDDADGMPGGPKLDVAGASGLPSDTMACADITVEIVPADVTIMLLIDGSASMNSSYGPNNENRWAAIETALLDRTTGVIANLQSEIKFGSTVYRSASGAPPCPDLTITVPPAFNNYDAIFARYPTTQDLLSDTPTGESLLATAQQLVAINDGSAKAIVLATDGVPDTCAVPNGDPAPALALAVQSAQTAFQMGIQTFIISVGDEISAGQGGVAHLRDMANAGVGKALDDPNPAPFFEANDLDALAEAFGTVITGFVPCDFKMNGQVEVDQACRGTVVLDGIERECGVDWVVSDPETLRLTGAACDALQDPSATHDLTATFPCAIISVG